MSREKGLRHRYGQHYTPPNIARLLAALAIKTGRDVVLDPACGDGRLLREAVELKVHLDPGHLFANAEVFGIERSDSAVREARKAHARVACADFFEVEPEARIGEGITLPLQFDAIIGNPPYIRQELLGTEGKRRIEEQLARDRAAMPNVFWPTWSRRSDVYVYFFARSIRFLKPGGRLVFLTASSWLDVGYGATLREFLLRNFRIVGVIESETESFFSDASINTAITVLVNEPDEEARNNAMVRFVSLTAPVADILSALSANSAEVSSGWHSLNRLAESLVAGDSTGGEILSGIAADRLFRLRTVSQKQMESEAAKGSPERARATSSVVSSGWGKYLRADEVFFQIVSRGDRRFRRLDELASVRFGVKTGANRFFYLTELEKETIATLEAGSVGSRKKRMKRLAEVAAVRRGMTTGANQFFYLKRADGDGKISPVLDGKLSDCGRDRLVDGEQNLNLVRVTDGSGAEHFIEDRYLAPVIFSLRDVSGVNLKRLGTGRVVFRCHATLEELGGTAALEYIRQGERAGYHKRPTCASRDQWYSVARGFDPAPLIFPSKVGERWVVALNRDRLYEDKKLYGIFPGPDVPDTLLAAMLNSTWARYYTEITCRQMTGAQSIADIDVVVAEGILLPDPAGLDPEVKNKLESGLSALAVRPVVSIFEEVRMPDRRFLDRAVLEAMGFREQREQDEVLEELYKAVLRLVDRRIRKGVISL